MKRVICFIDGFNVYHAIDDLGKDPKTKRPSGAKQHLKWLDLSALASAFVPQSSQTISKVLYFSAYATWLPDAYARHRQYVAALQAVGVTPIMGHFKNKHAKCNSCKATWTAHEEKESDVNLAISLIQAAYRDEFDRAIIMTADTDIVPAIKMVRTAFPEKIVDAIIPERRFQFAAEMKQACNNVLKAKEAHFERNLLPAEVRDKDGALVASRPEKYSPPKLRK